VKYGTHGGEAELFVVNYKDAVAFILLVLFVDINNRAKGYWALSALLLLS
jgi:hypothetical protein